MNKVNNLFLNVEPLLDEKSMGVKNYVKGFIRELIALNKRGNIFVDNVSVSLADLPDDFDYSSRDVMAILDKGSHLDYSVISKNKSVGVYFSPIKRDRVFNFEVEVIHDLGILICGDFHDRSTVNKLTPIIIKSIITNDLCLAVSDSTRVQLDNYFKKYSIRTKTIGCGPEITVDKSDDASIEGIRPYLLVLGTVEPRKNHKLIFQLIKNYPEIIAKFDIVFAGKFGWGKTIVQLATEAGISIDNYNGKIQLLNEVSEFEKFQLLKNATATIYPSFYEGFGMPCLESMLLGTPVVCSNSTSLPEVTSHLGFYFDPFSYKQLFDAVNSATNMDVDELALHKTKIKQLALSKNWKSVVGRALTAISELVESN
jgi:glycosyltransferase involved in cell wall biosynthesis